MSEVMSLFGDEILDIVPKQKRNKTLFDDYDGFVEKFKPKKTTDDCYTPPEVYDCILRWVEDNADIAGLRVIRPFYPGGDYKSIDYSGDCVVIDNPPFSIISEICRYYMARGIKFFLFSPHLTLFSTLMNCTYIVCGANITYENGAVVKTSFRSNLFGDIAILGVPDLYQVIKDCNKKKSDVKLPRYEYPSNILTVSMVSSIVEKGIPIRINRNDIAYCKQLDSQKKYKKSLFGNGFLLSDKAAAEKAAAEKAAAEKDGTIIWKLSDREKNIINALRKMI